MKKRFAVMLAALLAAGMMSTLPAMADDAGMDELIAAAQEEGELTVTPATLTIVTEGATKEYDGTALTADGTICRAKILQLTHNLIIKMLHHPPLT